MTNDNTDFVRALLKKLAKLNYIKPGDVPNINLYMDQVTTFMDEHLSDSKRHEDDKILTKTMINNYTKNDLLPAPVKKKYSKDHIYILAFIYYFKNLLSISDIQRLLNPLTNEFFESDDIPNLDDIYREVYGLCKSQVSDMSKDIFIKASKANASFENVTDEKEKSFLQMFSLVALLSFDVHMKKIIIQNLIDDFASKSESASDSKNAKKTDSNKKAEKKPTKHSEKSDKEEE